MCCDKSTCDNGINSHGCDKCTSPHGARALNWTVRDLAEATGLHRNTITNIEVGRYAGDPETLVKIENDNETCRRRIHRRKRRRAGSTTPKAINPEEDEIGAPQTNSSLAALVAAPQLGRTASSTDVRGAEGVTDVRLLD